MNTPPRRSTWLSFLVSGLAPGLALAMLASPALAAVTMNGQVTLDYYVGGTDTQGFEHTDSDFFVQQIDNTGARTGPLSLSGWATKDSSPAGAGSEIGYAPVGPAPANSVLDNFSATAPADDLSPGEYYTHVLLQDDSLPGTYEDSRTLAPTLLWRGGLEAVGPLTLYSSDGGRRVSVDFDQLRNKRIDARYTNDIVLTLYATYGFGPASDGHTLCSVRVAGLYAGDRRYNPGFDCAINAIPDGDYTVHLEVAEAGGRGGSSTLGGPDQFFSGGRMADHTVEVHAGALSLWMLAPFLALALLRPQFRRRSWAYAHTRVMKKQSAVRSLSMVIVGLGMSLALLLPQAGQAAVRADPGPPAGAKASTHASGHASGDAHFSTAELDRLLAPIALYPDSVLTQVLAASTYPLEVVEAARWSRERPELHGQDAVDSVRHMNWDPSVKALVAFPELLARMDSDLQWTQDLGDAFLGSEGEVMDRVQYLRDRADESGNLKLVEHVRVVRERELIYIEPDVAEIAYVPYYDPLVVYGDWWWPAYPPHRWLWWAGHPVSYYSYYGPFYWGLGFRIAPSFYFCAFDWPRREVVIVNHYQTNNNYYYGHSPERYQGASRWQHEPEHRHGVAYREPAQNEQWHRGYARPDLNEEHGQREGARGERREPRREWTVNRAEHRETMQQEPRESRQDRRESRRGQSSPAQQPSNERAAGDDRNERRSERQQEREAQRQDRGEVPRDQRREVQREAPREDRRDVQREERREAPQEQQPGTRDRQAQRRPHARDAEGEAGDRPDRGQRQHSEQR